MNTMSSKLRIVAVALLLGTATVAAAQDKIGARTFASQLQQYQDLSATAAGTYTFHTAPTLRDKPQDPVGGEPFIQRFADLQAESSNDSNMWQKTQPTFSLKAADPEPRESFAQRFAEMQAVSSNSGEWGFHPSADAPAYAANSTLVVVRPIARAARSLEIASQK